jgi:hypothetical protein
MLKSTKKALNIVSEEEAFIVGETDKNIYFKCKGSNTFHDVVYNKDKQLFSCTCKNLRFEMCSHIKACRIVFDEYKEAKENKRSYESL